jgi:ATP-dependent exoDNAse (exonuclease V) beta subunit
MGGYTSVISNIVDRRLQALIDNPRAKDRIEALTTAIRARVPEMRQRVQAVLSRGELQPMQRASITPAIPDAGFHAAGGPGPRTQLEPGSHPEVTLRAESTRWLGRADLLTLTGDSAELVDYKTGAPDTSHAEQLRIYALVWYRDQALNPSALS